MVSDVLAEWRAAVNEIVTEIYNLDFIKQLVKGDLALSTFKYYLIQDAYYLVEYSKILACASIFAPDLEAQTFWLTGAQTALMERDSLHTNWVNETEAQNFTINSVNINYLNHMKAPVLVGNYGELIAGILPCYWFYYEVATNLAPQISNGNRYKVWFDTYSDADFQIINDKAITIVGDYVKQAPKSLQDKMFQNFKISAQYEKDFFAMC